MKTTEFICFKRLFGIISSRLFVGEICSAKRVQSQILFVLLLLPATGFCQENMWKALADVSFKTVRDKNGFEIDRPVFGPKVKSLQGKTVSVSGFMIPLNELNGKNIFMLSAYPFSTCYFCGGAGPETVIEIESKTKVKFTDERIALTGQLQLNDADPDHHMYILKNVVELHEEN